ncbi:flagellar basal body-associated FliL family protein [Acuticoccus sp. I52.16.1]|uniref:flagellar basal body-associated FliL family protein n=1 Tax=Acuticoccus sp. I52.16.1 TaxID=2928472 RepID=UPI001FD19B5A|nr:flagellar basal body-associated FliL family protein [Acuticoccus sp. I52.16.1]UOM34300.1 flagellar basal body-associated FliL family protein [Acuticoccus sp. I52.16.1]
MEDDVTADELATDDGKKKGGMMGTILAAVVVTLMGGAAGAGLGMMQVDTIATVATKRANEAPVEKPALAWSKETTVTRLQPMITNLASPPGARIRLETAMVFDVAAVEDVERMKATLSTDLIAFLRTVSLGELIGASAYNHLRDDLNERVRAASSGTVNELLIETMVLQ